MTDPAQETINKLLSAQQAKNEAEQHLERLLAEAIGEHRITIAQASRALNIPDSTLRYRLRNITHVAHSTTPHEARLDTALMATDTYHRMGFFERCVCTALPMFVDQDDNGVYSPENIARHVFPAEYARQPREITAQTTDALVTIAKRGIIGVYDEREGERATRMFHYNGADGASGKVQA